MVPCRHAAVRTNEGCVCHVCLNVQLAARLNVPFEPSLGAGKSKPSPRNVVYHVAASQRDATQGRPNGASQAKGMPAQRWATTTVQRKGAGRR